MSENISILVTIVAIVGVVEFFHIGYLVARLRKNSQAIIAQLDQLLVASGVPEPWKTRRKHWAELAEGRPW